VAPPRHLLATEQEEARAVVVSASAAVEPRLRAAGRSNGTSIAMSVDATNRRIPRRRTGMSTRKAVVERYIEGFRRSDHTMVLSCLTDDVV
jgi:hypothetical protein